MSASVLLKLPALVLLKFQFFFHVLVCDSLQGDAGIALKSPDQKMVSWFKSLSHVNFPNVSISVR
jgi:hypothetical protein